MTEIYMVTHKQRWLNQEVRNVYYYETVDGAPTTSEWQDIVDEIAGDYLDHMDNRLSDEWEFYGIDYRRVDTGGLLSNEALPTAGAVPGENTSDSLPTQVAMLVSVKGVTIKPNRARTYLCGWPEDSMTDSLWLIGPKDAAELFIDLQSVLNVAGTNELQRVAAEWNSGHTAVILTNNIAGQASRTSPVPATQRRRRIGVGI